MPRLIELLLFAFLIYMFYRRLAGPFRRGFDDRERERREQQQQVRSQPRPSSRVHDETGPAKIDRTQVRDADFKDLD